MKSGEWRVKIGADVSGAAGQIKIVPPAAEHSNFYLLTTISYLEKQGPHRKVRPLLLRFYCSSFALHFARKRSLLMMARVWVPEPMGPLSSQARTVKSTILPFSDTAVISAST